MTDAGPVEGAAAAAQPAAEPSVGKRIVRFLVLLVFGMCTVLPFAVVLGNTLRPRMPTKRTPMMFGMKYEDVALKTSDGLTLQAWWIPARTGPSDRTMLVVHGVGANRDDAIRFYGFLNDNGYNILSWDWRGHGNSDWAQVTFGLREKRDLRAAVDWVMKERAPQAKWLGALGISMGAGILVQGGVLCPEIQLYVLDSPFGSVRTMLPFMLRTLPPVLRSVVCHLTELAAYVAIGVSVEDVAPLNVIGKLKRPVFISHGTADRVIPYQESENLYAAAAEPKELWIEKDIGHTELREYQEDRYHKRVLDFMQKHGAPASAR
jgi:alpha-beta hydrolase superfamily lysophospholipase